MPDEATIVTENLVLQDIADIKISRPDLTQDEWEIVEKAATYYKALTKPEVRQELELEYAAKYDEFVSSANQQTKDLVAAKFEEWKKAQEPLNADELKKLVSQEYEEVPVRINSADGVRTFTIREVPKSVEKRFVNLARKTIVPLLEEKALAKFKWNFDSSMGEKINSILSLIPNGLDVMADLCAICLDPFEKEKDINGAWVSANISSTRIEAIILLQFEVNKYRDFFFHGLKLFQTLSNKQTM